MPEWQPLSKRGCVLIDEARVTWWSLFWASRKGTDTMRTFSTLLLAGIFGATILAIHPAIGHADHDGT